MASTSLTDKQTKDVYTGLIHAGGQALPLTDTAVLYDGYGQASSLSIGLSSNGAEIAGGLLCTGQLSAGNIRFTTTDSPSGANFPLVSNGNGLAEFGQINSESIIDLLPAPTGMYRNIQNIAVDSRGLITNAVGNSTADTAWMTFDGADVSFSYTISNLVVTCLSIGHTLKTGDIITVVNATDTGLNGTVVVQSANTATGVFTFANPTAITSSTGIGTIDVTVKASYNACSVTCDGTGVYTIDFSTAFSNKDYVAVCGAKYPTGATTAIENLQVNVVSKTVNSITVRCFYITGSDQVTEYDGYISVYCTGSSVSDNAPVPISFDCFTNTNYFWSPSVNSGTQNQIISITPSLMASNKWNAIVVGVKAFMNCLAGSANITSNNTVNGTDTTTIEWSNAGNTRATAFVYVVCLYTNNTLKYGQFYFTNSSWSTESVNDTDINDKAAATAIFSGLFSQDIPGTTLLSNSNDTAPGNWLINFLNTYGDQLTVVNSVDINMSSSATQTGSCNGDYNMYQNYVKYYTPQ